MSIVRLTASAPNEVASRTTGGLSDVGRAPRGVRPRPALVVLVVATLAAGLIGAGAVAQIASAQQADRVALVSNYFAATAQGDVDGAMDAFAPNPVFIGARQTGVCSAQSPCTDLDAIRQQIEGNVALHTCQTIRAVQVSGSVVLGQIESRQDGARANGIERTLQSFLAQIPQDKITFIAVVNDLTDPQTISQAAITAGTQPRGVPIPNPPNPCGSM